MHADIVVIGGGPAGLAAAAQAAEKDVDVLLLEREKELGGILPQCIHMGFGNFVLGEMLTGPEYAHHYIKQVNKKNIRVKTETMVLEIQKDKTIIAINKKEGLLKVRPRAIILAMGCRERTRNQILLPGSRPAGIYTAGSAQQFINVKGVMPGKNVVILGSGDVGLIMARRFLLEGATVKGVFEIMPAPGGLTRNIVQCLQDYDIPLFLSHTVTNIHGNHRITGVTIAKIDEKTMKPIKETERFIACDTLLLAVGLIPENELSKQIDLSLDEVTGGPVVDQYMQTSVDGVFACGNVVHVHDLVDDVTIASEQAGKYAAQFVLEGLEKTVEKKLLAGKNVSYVVPQLITDIPSEDITLYLRVKKKKENVSCSIDAADNVLFNQKKRIVKPPEMVKITLPAERVKKCRTNELTIQVGDQK
ncbi:MAG: FAD-dependent oxidoreductase [Thermoplasmatota archaeon]